MENILSPERRFRKNIIITDQNPSGEFLVIVLKPLNLHTGAYSCIISPSDFYLLKNDHCIDFRMCFAVSPENLNLLLSKGDDSFRFNGEEINDPCLDKIQSEARDNGDSPLIEQFLDHF